MCQKKPISHSSRQPLLERCVASVSGQRCWALLKTRVLDKHKQTRQRPLWLSVLMNQRIDLLAFSFSPCLHVFLYLINTLRRSLSPSLCLLCLYGSQLPLGIPITGGPSMGEGEGGEQEGNAEWEWEEEGSMKRFGGGGGKPRRAMFIIGQGRHCPPTTHTHCAYFQCSLTSVQTLISHGCFTLAA